VVRAASASQMVEYAFEVPTSRIHRAGAAWTRIQSSRPVSGVMFSLASVVLGAGPSQLVEQPLERFVHESLT